MESKALTPIEFRGKKLRVAQDLSIKTIEAIGMKLLKRNAQGAFEMPDRFIVAGYLNDLASKNQIKKYVLTGEYEQVYLFDQDDVISHLEITEHEAQKTTEVIKIQCYDERVTHEDSLPLEISNIEDLFKLPRSLFNSGCCIYFLCRDNKVVYVGQAENVHQRLVEHMRTKNFDAVFYIRVQAHRMGKIEAALISYLKPEYNKVVYANATNQSLSMAASILQTA